MNQNDHPNGQSTGKTNRGFAAMDQSRQREIARKGGEARGRNRHKSPNA